MFLAFQFCKIIWVHLFYLFFFSPITYAWEGGKLISENDDFEDMVVTREDYEENGHSICEEKFDI